MHFPGMAGQWPVREALRTKAGMVQIGYTLVDTREGLEAMVRALEGKVVAHDTETSGLNPHLGARVCGHAFACFTEPRSIHTWYVPIRHIGGHNETEAQLSPVLLSQAVGTIWQFAERLVFFHGKFDWAQCRADGAVFSRSYLYDDVATLATADNENEWSFALKNLANRYCTPDAASEQKQLENWMREDARKLGVPYRTRRREREGILGEPSYIERFGYSRTPIRLCGLYACKDVFYTLYLWAFTYDKARAQWSTVIGREHQVQRLLHEMEWNGLPVDVDLIRDTHDRCHKEYAHWLAQCRAITGDASFTGSDPEVRTLLFQKLGMKPPKQTKKNQASVDREARGILARQYPDYAPLFHALDKLSRAQKLDTTYTGNFLRYVSPKNRIHASYNQIERKAEGGVPVTGRLSSADPNMQNIDNRPVTLVDGSTVEIRRYFRVPEDHIRFYIDFSQIELRVLAWYCQDPVLLHCYQQGLDVHQIIADQLGIPRKVAKQVNFGNSYGMTEIGLALRLPGYFDDPEGTRRYAKRVLEAYFARYKNIRLFRDAAAAEMIKNGGLFVNPFGRPRRIPTIASTERAELGRAKRMMMSSIVSGTAADLMKESMIRCDAIGQHPDTPALCVQTIHDELVFDVPLQSAWATTLVKLVRAMEDWPMFSNPPDRQGVPIKVSAELSTTTWADKRGVEILEDNTLRWAA